MEAAADVAVAGDTGASAGREEVSQAVVGVPSMIIVLLPLLPNCPAVPGRTLSGVSRFVDGGPAAGCAVPGRLCPVGGLRLVGW